MFPVGVKELYSGIEANWYSLLDAIAAKGVPVYSVIDPLENAGVPSLPLVAGIGIILIALIAYFALGAAGGMAGLKVTVTSNDTALANATVAAGGYEAMTDAKGLAELQLPRGSVEIEVSAPGCESQNKSVNAPGSAEFELTCRTSPPVGACSTIAEEYTTATVLGEGNTPLTDCSVAALDTAGEPVEVQWGIDGNTLYLDGSVCLQDDYSIQISCLEHARTMTIDELRADMAERGEITLYLKGTTDGGALTDCDADGIPDSRDRDNDNDGIFDVDDMDVDGDGIMNAQDADSCGQDTRIEDFVPATPIAGDEQGILPDAATYATYVKVFADTGGALDGIAITAVDSSDSKIDTGYGNAVVEARTVNGSATLLLPSGQKYYIRAEDPKNVYRPAKSQLMIQTRQMDARLVMQKGFPTTITVVGPKPVPYATVRVLDEPVQEKQASAGGKATFVLDKGEKYSVVVLHDDYMMLETSITGGTDATLALSPLDASNAGTLRVTVVNGKGIEEGMAGVRVDVATAKGVVQKSCTSAASGLCDFRKVLAGDYVLRATPQGDVDYQEGEKLTIAAGATVEKRMLVNPTAVELRVLTKVGGNPAKDVKVTLYDMTYGVPEKIDSAKSGDNRRVVFKTYRGKNVYLEAEFGEFGPTTTSPFKLDGNREMEIDLQKITRSVSFVPPAGAEIAAGATKDGKLVLDLPYADDKAKTKYKTASVEVWIGEPGDKSNPARTPVVLGAIDTYVFDKQQRPRVTVSAGDAFSYSQEATSGDPATTSKYLKFTITDYDPTAYEIAVPLVARSGASGSTTVHYRATWTDASRRIFTSGDWKTANITITPASSDDQANWLPASGDFSSYNAWLSTSPEIANEAKADKTQAKQDAAAEVFFPKDYKAPAVKENGVPVFSDGTTLYLHLRAIAAKEGSSYLVKLDSFPPLGEGDKHLVPLAYRGTITKGDKTQLIYPAKLGGAMPLSFSPASQSKEYYALDVNDELHLVVALQAKGAADAAELAVLNDLENTLKYRVKAVANKFENTTVANVEARLQLLTTLCPNAPYLGKCTVGETSANQTLPSYDLARAEGREFEMRIALNNTGDAQADVLFDVEASGIDNLTFPDTAAIAAKQQQELVVKGRGAAAQGGTISVYLWADGDERKLWKTVKHGAVEYALEIEGIDAEGASLPTLSTHTKEIVVSALRKSFDKPKGEQITSGFMTDGHADAIRLAMSKLEAWASLKIDLENGTRYSADTPSLSWGFLTATAGHSEFGALSRAFEVHGALFTPGVANNSFVLDDSSPNRTFNFARVTNNWDELLRVKLTAGLQDTVEGQSFGLSKELRVFDAQGFELEPENRNGDSRDVPARGRAELWITAKPPGTGCNVAPSVNKLSVDAEAKTSGVVDSGNYQVMFTCKFQAGPSAQGALRANKVLKEDDEPTSEDMTADSCTASGDFAAICDAQQFSVALMKGAQELDGSDNVDLVKRFALADDVVNPTVMSRAMKWGGVTYPTSVIYGEAQATGGSLVLSQQEITCGLVTVLYEKIAGPAIRATIRVDKNVGWCGGANAFLGIMNYDGDLRGDAAAGKIVKYASFNGDYATFYNAVVKWAPESQFFGYSKPADASGEAEAPHVVYYQEWSKTEFAASVDPNYKWLSAKYASTGYYNINAQGDVQLGIVYTNKDNLDKQRDCMVSNLVNYWTMGKAPGMQIGGNTKQAFDLDKCLVAEKLAVPKITTMTLIATDAEPKPAGATGKQEIAVQLTTDMKVRACYLWNLGSERASSGIESFAAGYETGTAGEMAVDGKSLNEDIWTLGGTTDGVYTVKAACITEQGVWSQRESKQIILDKTPPVISGVSWWDGAKQIGGATANTAPTVKFTVKDKYEVSSCSVKGLCPSIGDSDACTVTFTKKDAIGMNDYSVSCTSPVLTVNGNVPTTCTPTGTNELNVTCADEHGNEGGAGTMMYLLSPGQTAKPIDYSCESYRDTYITRMHTSAGNVDCKDEYPDEPYGFFKDGLDFYVNSDDITIPIVVTSENPLTDVCQMSNGKSGADARTASCGAPTVVNDYQHKYDCRTISLDGTHVLVEGRNTGVTIECTEKGGTTLSATMEDIVVDTKAPVTTYEQLMFGNPIRTRHPQNIVANFTVDDNNSFTDSGNFAHSALMRYSMIEGSPTACPTSASGFTTGIKNTFTDTAVDAMREQYTTQNFQEEDRSKLGYNICYSAIDRVGNEETPKGKWEFNSARECMSLDYANCMGATDHSFCLYSYTYASDVCDCVNDDCGKKWLGGAMIVGGVALTIGSFGTLSEIGLPLAAAGVGIGGATIGMGISNQFGGCSDLTVGTGHPATTAPPDEDLVAGGCYSAWDIAVSWSEVGEFLNQEECTAAGEKNEDGSGYFTTAKKCDPWGCGADWMKIWYTWDSTMNTCNYHVNGVD